MIRPCHRVGGHLASTITALAVLAAPQVWAAEQMEHAISAEGIVVFPGFKSSEATSFASAGFGARISYEFGVLSNLSVLTRGAFWLQEGQIENYAAEVAGQGRLSGDLQFRGEVFRGEVGLRYDWLGGFNFAPYVEAYFGGQWATFRELSLRQEGAVLNAALESFGEGAPTASVALAFEYRLANTLNIGVSAGYSRVFSGSYEQDVTVALKASYYWF